MSSIHQQFMSSYTFKSALADSLERKMARVRPFSSKRFREDLLSKALEMKIESFEDVRERLDEGSQSHLYKNAKLFVRGLLTYMGDNSNFPYTFYPEGITKVENMYPDDDTWEVQITHTGERGDRTIDASIRLVEKGRNAERVVAEHFDNIGVCFINRDILLSNIDDAIEDMEQHLIESDENDGYEEEVRVGGKWFKCESCPICFEKLEDDDNQFIPKCGHPVCGDCKKNIDKCPTCRASYKVMGYYYDDAKELVENEVEDCIHREDDDRLRTLVNLSSVALQCLEEDGFCHSIGYEYEADWGYADGLPDETNYYWVLREI